eukprot:3215854-Rhodomonas_salina.3
MLDITLTIVFVLLRQRKRRRRGEKQRGPAAPTHPPHGTTPPLVHASAARCPVLLKVIWYHLSVLAVPSLVLTLAMLLTGARQRRRFNPQLFETRPLLS